MMGVVADVFPEYENEIALVDVIVSEQRNRSLMERYGIRAIPTLIFFNASGQAQTIVGALEPQDFQDMLESIVK